MPEPIPPVETSPEVARKNVMLAVGLAVAALLIAGGGVLVAFIYLQYD
jgi:hypothetical protein